MIIDAKLTPAYDADDENGKRGSVDFVMSQSSLKQFAANPHKWRHGEKKDRTMPMLFGSLVDAMFLTPKEVKKRFAITPETYTNDKGEEKPWSWNANVCKEWRNKQTKEIVSADMRDTAKAAVASLKDCQLVADVLRCADTQVGLAANWKADNGVVVPLRGMIDILPKRDSAWESAIVDLKTAQDGSRGKWSRVIWDNGLHIQAAMYLDMYNAATDESREQFLHIIVESAHPHEVGRREVGMEFISLGRAQYRHWLNRYAECLKLNVWPGWEADNEWTLCSPEPWMILKADAPLGNGSDIMDG